jgi:hypothetical protein
MTVRRTDLAGGARAVDEIVRRLSDPQEIAQAIGTATASAINVQGGRVSSPPQARIVAGAFRYSGESISLSVGAVAGHGSAGELVWGSEFGSDRYLQFGPRHSGGTWIFPVLRDIPKPVIAAGDDAVDQLIGDAL